MLPQICYGPVTLHSSLFTDVLLIPVQASHPNSCPEYARTPHPHVQPAPTDQEPPTDETGPKAVDGDVAPEADTPCMPSPSPAIHRQVAITTTSV